MLALFPGAITFSFAVHEATSLNSDWVKIATPLLLIGAASFVWLLKIKLGTPGVGVGAAISLAAFGYASFHFNTTVTERVRWMASSRALSDTDRFCVGEIKPNAAALAFNEKGGNKAVFFKGNGSSPQADYSDPLDQFRPSPHQIENASLVSCMMEKLVNVETCSGYTGGATVDRERVDLSIKVFSIKTGQVVFEKLVEGESPRNCSSTEQFYGKSLHTTITGKRPETDIVAELSPLLK